ncbi:hypothetical protein [Falsirhodobacter halotolerans]|uniref:hypothetical protein n=1 Tax=Falsirhodobacter halotolerans TaxID=1146892 RepID=UPI001FD17121|nr:hypothetical protein [Falsirhodobacter halotolerans]MCJ8140682.1 hypothetical protein [Falsirhodobacter halotolerans]
MGSYITIIVTADKCAMGIAGVKYVLAAMAMLWAGMVGAQGTRHDMASQLGAMRVEVTMTSGISLEHTAGAIRFLSRTDKDDAGTLIPLILDAVRRSGTSGIYTYRIADDYLREASGFWERNWLPDRSAIRLPVCATRNPARPESVSHRISVPGFGYLPRSALTQAEMRDLMRNLDPCTSLPTAR